MRMPRIRAAGQDQAVPPLAREPTARQGLAGENLIRRDGAPHENDGERQEAGHDEVKHLDQRERSNGEEGELALLHRQDEPRRHQPNGQAHRQQHEGCSHQPGACTISGKLPHEAPGCRWLPQGEEGEADADRAVQGIGEHNDRDPPKDDRGAWPEADDVLIAGQRVRQQECEHGEADDAGEDDGHAVP
ncbi:MAG: hypothetical protein GEU73_15605 [Chloroflexi bacterium]|nr:hypothetical protein [Chloroflexota bacterium]